MSRTLIASFIVALSLFAASRVDAQTCDPYRTRIPIDYRTYPTPETAAAFFATLDQGEPVEGHAPYVWRHDAQGWHWSCASTIPEAPAPEPTPTPTTTLEVGRYYSNPYGHVAKVIGIVSPVGESTPQWLLQSVTPNGGFCGRLGFLGMGADELDILREVAPMDVPKNCPMAITIEQ